MSKMIVFIVISFFTNYAAGSSFQYDKMAQKGYDIDFKLNKKCAEDGDVVCKLRMGFYYLYGGSRFELGAEEKVDIIAANKYFYDITGRSPSARMGMARISLLNDKNKEAFSLIKSAAVEGLADAKAQLAFPSEEGGQYMFVDFDMNLYWSRSLLKDFPDDDILRGNIGLAMINNKNQKWWRE